MGLARGKKREATPLQGGASGVGQASRGRGKGQTTYKETKALTGKEAILKVHPPQISAFVSPAPKKQPLKNAKLITSAGKMTCHLLQVATSCSCGQMTEPAQCLGTLQKAFHGQSAKEKGTIFNPGWVMQESQERGAPGALAGEGRGETPSGQRQESLSGWRLNALEGVEGFVPINVVLSGESALRARGGMGAGPWRVGF